MQYVGSYGIYPWYPEDGVGFLHPDDADAFSAIWPKTKVFKCVGRNDYLTLSYAGKEFRVRPDLFKPVTTPRFSYGAPVVAAHKGKPSRAIVADIEWHHNNQAHIYYLSFDGKKSSRRYSESELTRVE